MSDDAPAANELIATLDSALRRSGLGSLDADGLGRCPSCRDPEPTLRVAHDGESLGIRCRSGCTASDVSRALLKAADPADAEDERKRRPIVTRLADVEPESVSWLWPGRIVRGAVNVIDGDPDNGKSALTLDIAARVSTGRAMPDGTGAAAPADVIVVSYEDHLATTIRPRLDAAGADAARVHALAIDTDHGVDMPSLPGDLAILEETIEATRAELVIVDPLVAALSGAVDGHRDQDIRRVLAPLRALAEATGCAILVVRHLRKSGGSAKHAGGGSIGITGAARSVMLVAADPEDPERRVLARSKCNLAAPVASLGYRLVPKGSTVAVEWLGAVEHAADALLEAAAHGTEERTERSEAEEWLADALAGGPRPVGELRQAWRREGHADRTMKRAKAALGVESRKTGLREGWSWALHPKGANARPALNVAPFEDSGPLRAESGTCAAPVAPDSPNRARDEPLVPFERPENEPPPHTDDDAPAEIDGDDGASWWGEL